MATDLTEQEQKPQAPEVSPSPATSSVLATVVGPSEPRKDTDFVTVPTYSRWFSFDGIDECEIKHLPEFFDGKSPSKNPNVYKYYRNSIINYYRSSSSSSSSKKLTFTEVRRTIVGDVGSIRRVFDFLQTWGLINYSPVVKQPFKWEERENKANNAAAAASPAAAAGGGGGGDGAVAHSNANANATEKLHKWCSGCKIPCTIACFVSDKYDLVLCARCYVRGNYRMGVSSTEFRRVEIGEREPAKTDWTDKETLQLLEAIMHYGDNWKRVSEHVGGRTEKDCVARFIKLPFGEQFVELADQGDEDSLSHQSKDQANAESEIEPSAKRRHLTPLADASNPIMAQAAFLSALAGVEVSEAAARAAVATLYDNLTSRGSVLSHAPSLREQEPAVATNGSSLCAPEEVRLDAGSLLKQEEDEFLESISNINEVQMKRIQDRIVHLDQMVLQLERERHQLQQMKHQLFLDQLTLVFNKAAVPKSIGNVVEENGRTE